MPRGISFGDSIAHFARFLRTTNWNRVVILIFIALLGIGLGVGFSIASDNAKSAFTEDSAHRSKVFSDWQMTLTSHFAKAASLATSLATYVTASATVPMNFSSPANERIIVLNNDAFNRMCADLFSQVPGIMTLEIHSGGVIAQAYPSNATFGLDIMHFPAETVSYYLMVDSGHPITVGPAPHHLGGMAIFVRYPVYTNVAKGRENFWGTGNVVMRLEEMFAALNVSRLLTEHGMDYYCWCETIATGTSEVLSTSNPSLGPVIVRDGMRMELPISENGKATYFAIYPQGGAVRDVISTSTIVLIVVIVFLGALFVVVLTYGLLFSVFLFRHRFTPCVTAAETPTKDKTHRSVSKFATHMTHIGLFTLKGAQPFVENAPLDAFVILKKFTSYVTATAPQFKCYAVCDIGDRSVYVVASEAVSLARFAQHIAQMHPTHCIVQHPSTITENQNNRYPANQITQTRITVNSNGNSQLASDSFATSQRRAMAQSSVLSSPSNQNSQSANDTIYVCHSAIVLHSSNVLRCFDDERNVYFYGTPQALSQLGAAMDSITGGQVLWSHAFASRLPSGVDVLNSTAGALVVTDCPNVVLEGSASTCTVWHALHASDRSDDDPPLTMTMVSDAYVKRMLLQAGTSAQRERGGSRRGRGEKGGGHGAGSSDEGSSSNEITHISRPATILHIAFSGDISSVFDVTRRAITRERGVVLSVHNNILVAAFNLLSVGGHHQMHAARTVEALRAQFCTGDDVTKQQIAFVASIHCGKVNALLVDGKVMCYGAPVVVGMQLLKHAVALSRLPFEHITGTPKESSSSHHPSDISNSDDIANGLCLLYCHSELSSMYNCEAIDVINTSADHKEFQHQGENVDGQTSGTFRIVADGSVRRDEVSTFTAPTGGKVLYRLGTPMADAKDDEWMYQLKEGDEKSAHAALNAVFLKISVGDLAAARAAFEKITSINNDMNGHEKHASANLSCSSNSGLGVVAPFGRPAVSDDAVASYTKTVNAGAVTSPTDKIAPTMHRVPETLPVSSNIRGASHFAVSSVRALLFADQEK